MMGSSMSMYTCMRIRAPMPMLRELVHMSVARRSGNYTGLAAAVGHFSMTCAVMTATQ